MKNILFCLTLSCLFFCLSAHSQDLIEDINQYHQNSKWQKSTAIDLVKNFAKKQHLTGEETLLDVCSGDGNITAAIATMLPKGQVTGVDISANMVNFASQHYAKTISNVKFSKMDATQLHFHNNFDVITSFTCMHLIPNQPEVLKGMYESLKHKGKLLLLFPVVHGFGKALQEVVASEKWVMHFSEFQTNWNFFHPNVYQSYLQDAGFSAQRIEILRKDETYANREVFSDSISHWLPHLKILPQNLRAAFLNDLVTTYLYHVPPDADGQIHFYVDNLVVEASKL